MNMELSSFTNHGVPGSNVSYLILLPLSDVTKELPAAKDEIEGKND